MDRLQLSIEPRTLSVLREVSQFFSQQGIKSYLVGGFVRDVLLHRNTADIDIAVDADAVDTGEKLAGILEGKCVLLDEANRICRIVVPEIEAASGRIELDLSTLRGSIEDDLAERDFTIDALAVDLAGLAAYPGLDIIDPFEGRRDLERKTVRAVRESVFEHDGARLLRAARLSAELGFQIEPFTEGLIKRNRSLITRVAGERSREELLRLLAVPAPGVLFYLDELGLLTALIPELEAAKGVEQPIEHFWDVFNHLIRTVAAVDFLLRRGDWPVLGKPAKEEALGATPWSDMLGGYFSQSVSHGSNRRLLLKVAALLHDIAKPQTKTFEEYGRVRFLGHPQEGAEVAGSVLERLRFSTREINLVRLVVENHMRPTQMSQEGLPTRRAIYRYFRDTGDAGIDTLFLSLADHLASRGPGLDMEGWREHARIVQYVIEKQFETQVISPPPKLIDGNDLINIFGLEPGPKIGELLEAVRESQAAGELASRDEALSFIRRKLN